MAHFQITYGNKGQALIELALFGSLLVFLLGVLINYGLTYNFNQKAMMESFRRALGYADDGSTYVYFKDKHIPDPINQFAMGHFVPITASAGVTRNYQLQVTPDPGVYSDLPGMILNMNGTEREYKTAGYRREGDIAISNKGKYEKVYPVVVCKGTDMPFCDSDDGGNPGNPICRESTWDSDCSCFIEAAVGIPTCSGGSPVCSIGTLGCSNWMSPYCQLVTEDTTNCYNAEVMDSCEGNIIGYDSCRKQCMVIVDSRTCTKVPGSGGYTFISDCACETECEATTGPETSTDTETYCRNLCAQSMNSPWYCQPGLGGRTFVLDDIVNQTYRYQMGLQPGYQKSAPTNTTFTRQENMSINYPQSIDTTDDVNWQETITRYVVWNDNLDANGYTRMSGNNIRDTNMVTKGDVKQTKWLTPW